MTIASFDFILFIAVVLFLYYLSPVRVRWLVLLAGSYVFYWLNSKWLILVLMGTSIITYIFGLILQRGNDQYLNNLKNNKQMNKEEKKKQKERLKKINRKVLTLGILLVLSILLFLKYYNFFGDNLNILFNRIESGWSISHLNLILPIGISFFTLQAISYMVDVYRGKIGADRNLAKFLLYMSFFPQIIQGPIPRYDKLARQLYEGHSFDYQRTCFGAQLILWGFIKKLVIAERLAIPVSHLFENYEEYSGPVLFFAVVLYGFQIYTDFSGGIDITRGVAQLFGIDLDLNFRQPYYAKSIEEFWRRWHITMGSWMKDYIFYPLSLSTAFTKLSRKSRKMLGQFAGKRLPAFLAMFIVYFCVGFWHGPDWKYIIYGVWNGFFIMISILLENVYEKGRSLCKINAKTITWRLFCMMRTLVIISTGRFFTGSKDVHSALSMFGRVFRNWQDITFITDGSLLKMGLNNANWILLAVLITILLYVDFKHEHGISLREVFARQPLVFRWAIYIIAIMAVLIFGYYGPEYDATSFIYEQF